MKRVILPGIAAAVALLGLVPVMRGQSCSGNGDVVGSYALVGSRFAAATGTVNGVGGVGVMDAGGSGSTGSGSATGTATASNTPVGNLLGDVTGTAAFGTVARIFADGSGHLFAPSNLFTTASNSPMTSVGSYTVNTDCTIKVTLTDTFAAQASTAPGTSGSSGTSIISGGTSTGSTTASGATTAPSATLEGLVLAGGTQIDLVESSSPTGVAFQMRKMFQLTGCTNATLSGGFIVVSQVFSPVSSAASGTTGTGSQVSFPLVARLAANGNGMFITDALGQASSLPGMQLTGTYTVNSDCTGSGEFVTNTGVTRMFNFAIVQSPASACSARPGQRAAPELLFNFSDTGIVGIGTALSQ